MSQETLSAKAHINRVTLARLERGRHQPTLDTLARIARALGVTLRIELVERAPARRRRG